MNRALYSQIEKYMLSYMDDGAHDEQHIYRVLYFALEIAANYSVDLDVLIVAALLHDIGRKAQFENPTKDHAIVGAEMAYEYIRGLGWHEETAHHIKQCIVTHRYRTNQEPKTLEAKILFDADKLDVSGAIGIARTLAYKGIVAEPLYTTDSAGNILDGTHEQEPSFFREYHFKLKNIYDHFYTERAKEIAMGRKEAARFIYETLLQEVKETYAEGKRKLDETLELS